MGRSRLSENCISCYFKHLVETKSTMYVPSSWSMASTMLGRNSLPLVLLGECRVSKSRNETLAENL